MPDDQAQDTPQPAPEGQPGPAAPVAEAGGEAQAAPAESGQPAGAEPRLLAGKYSSPEELERAYQEAQSALGRKNDELGQLRREYNYLAQQFGYDPLADDEGTIAATPPPPAQAPWQPPPPARPLPRGTAPHPAPNSRAWAR